MAPQSAVSEVLLPACVRCTIAVSNSWSGTHDRCLRGEAVSPQLRAGKGANMGLEKGEGGLSAKGCLRPTTKGTIESDIHRLFQST